jgi:hypothetical protein
MQTLAGRRCAQKGCSDARCFAAYPYAFALVSSKRLEAVHFRSCGRGKDVSGWTLAKSPIVHSFFYYSIASVSV